MRALFYEKLTGDLEIVIGRININGSRALKDSSVSLKLAVRRLRVKRLFRYALVMGVTFLSSLGVTTLYALHWTAPSEVFYGVLESLIAVAFSSMSGIAYRQIFDTFIDKSNTSKRDALSNARVRIKSIVREEFSAHNFAGLDEETFKAELVDAYERVIRCDPDGWSAETSLRATELANACGKYAELKSAYEGTVTQSSAEIAKCFDMASKNAIHLERIADRIKEQTIRPSFEIFKTTQIDLERLRSEIFSVSFIG